jgi:hypothetical protein
MKFFSFNFFNLLRARVSKLTALLQAHEKAKKRFEQEWGCVDLKVYTMVDRTPGGRKCDLLTSVHMGSRQLDQARVSQKVGNARWHHNVYEQEYKPREVRIDRQLEFIYDKLELNKDIEQTVIGSPNQLT